MTGGAPSPRFIRKHGRGRLVYLPRHLTDPGELSEQEYQIVCECAWHSDASTSQTLISGQHMDHIWQAWSNAKAES